MRKGGKYLALTSLPKGWKGKTSSRKGRNQGGKERELRKGDEKAQSQGGKVRAYLLRGGCAMSKRDTIGVWKGGARSGLGTKKRSRGRALRTKRISSYNNKSRIWSMGERGGETSEIR